MDHKQSQQTPQFESGNAFASPRLGFSARMLIAVSVFAVATIGVYIAFVHQPIVKRLGEIKEAEIRTLHRILTDQAERSLDQLKAEVSRLAKSPEVRPMQRVNLDRVLVQAESTTTMFEKFSVLDVNGTVVSRPSMPSTVGSDRSDRLYFKETIQKAGVHLDDVRRTTTGLSLSVAAPIRSVKGEVHGVVVGHMELARRSPWLCRTDERFAASVLHEAFLVSPTGRKAAHSMGEMEAGTAAEIEFESHPILKVDAERASSLVFTWRGRDWFGLVTQLDDSGWRLITQVDRDIVETAAFAAIDGVGWMVALSFLGLLSLTVFYAYRVGRPVRELSAALAEYGQTGRSRALPIALARGEIGRLIHAFNHMLAGRGEVESELVRRQTELRQLAAELSRVEQRTRREIAGELHDHISQDLAATKIRLELMRDALDDDSRENLDVAIELLHGCISSTSQMTSRLAQPAIEQLGLVKAIEGLVAATREQYSIDCRLECEEQTVALDGVRLDVVYRGVSELLHNVVKHAKASIVRVKILIAGDELFVEVGDDGIGFTPETRRPREGQVGGYGLFALRERIRQFGGAVRVESAPNQGCLVTMRLPIHETRVFKDTHGSTQRLGNTAVKTLPES